MKPYAAIFIPGNAYFSARQAQAKASIVQQGMFKEAASGNSTSNMIISCLYYKLSYRRSRKIKKKNRIKK